MELRQLQCLIACAQTQSFSKAASLLFTTQSNVSKTIASLEKELGKPLFVRKQHGIELTEKGKQIYKHAVSMMDFSEKILECAREEDVEELRIAFQPSSWFATTFCDYFIQHGESGKKFYVTSATVDEIIRRISGDLDHLGFAYIEDTQLGKLQEVFQTNHISYYMLKKTKNVLYCGKEAGVDSKQDLLLIQGVEDHYSGLSAWKDKMSEKEQGIHPRTAVTTNSDYVMQEMLKRTRLCNISPEYLSHQATASWEGLEEEEQTVQFICMFRNDRTMEKMPKHFLSFVRKSISEKY